MLIMLCSLADLEPLTLDNFEPVPPPAGQPKVVPINQKYEVKCIAPEGLPTPTLR